MSLNHKNNTLNKGGSMNWKIMSVAGILVIAGFSSMIGATSPEKPMVEEQPTVRTDGFVPFPAWVNETSSTGRYQTSTSVADLRAIMLMRERVVVPNTNPVQYTSRPVWVDANLISEITPAPSTGPHAGHTHVIIVEPYTQTRIMEGPPENYAWVWARITLKKVYSVPTTPMQ